MSIQQLPENVIAQIKSSTTITSLNRVICGLVENSLDAKATKITISIDYIRGNCSVEDNGLGIPPNEFKPTGGLNRLHYTSKFPPRNDNHGRYGTFLASVASLSLLSITSHHHGYHSHNSIKIHNSEVLARHTPSLPEQRLLSFPHGTRVAVRDLFGSMPVRVKQRVIDADRGTNAKDWERLKRALVALLLAWPGQVTVSFRDSIDQHSFTIRVPEDASDIEGEKNGTLGLTTRVSRTLFQAQLADDRSRDLWVPLKASAGRISVIGAVSLVPVASRQIQFISIGVRPVSNEHGSNVLYEEINRLFANSSFGIEEEGDLNKDEKNRRAKDRRYKTDGYTNQELRGRKGVDRWPMFYIKINLGEEISRLAEGDVEGILDEQQEGLRAIIDILTAVIYEFLRTHHFRPKYPKSRATTSSRQSNTRNKRSKSLSRSSTPRTDSKTDRTRVSRSHISSGDLASTRLNLTSDIFRLRPQSPFDSWTRIKSGQPQFAHFHEKPSLARESTEERGYSQTLPLAGTPPLNGGDDMSETPLVAPDGTLLRIPFPEVEFETFEINKEHTPNDNNIKEEQPQPREGEEVLWTSPATQETLVIDSRTGLVVRPLKGNAARPEALGDAFHLSSRKKLRTNARPILRDERSRWLGDLLSSWDNPVFQSQEPPIPVAFDEAKALAFVKPSEGHCHRCDSMTLDTLQASHSVEGRLSKDNLRDARVIAQVDRKFILVKIPLSSVGRSGEETEASLLVIVDQHAADERCRVETLMKDYFVVADDAETSTTGRPQQSFQAVAEPLEKPIAFDISSQDCSQFERSARYFEHWGVFFQIRSIPKPKRTVKRAAQLIILKLPPSIAGRCLLEPRLLIELLRKEVWKIDEQGHNVSRDMITEATKGDSENPAGLHWLARFHGCPNGILEMINSRACRSSIMFNDHLSRQECDGLVERLADCALPFQCAHGRPSMVPLVDLGNIPMSMVDVEKPVGSFAEEFRRWKSSIGD
ncbi:hypothetical protein F4677DRAFT_402324 [Hypoxylon crocopeplum]|nr:hypothetical protein F4677DRAFT_402324 [Hypoxylon crocopeplum]